MPRPKLEPDEAKSRTVNIRVPAELHAQLEAITAAAPLKKHAVARQALEWGLAAMASDPTWPLKTKVPQRVTLSPAEVRKARGR